MRGQNYVVQNTHAQKSVLGVWNKVQITFRLEFLILLLSGRLKPTCDTLAWSKKTFT